MTKKNKYKPDDKEQSKLFLNKAREIGRGRRTFGRRMH
jgi:hypothetical protein